jgi:hypothetical protein
MKKLSSEYADIESLCLPPSSDAPATVVGETIARPRRWFTKDDGFYFRMPLAWFLPAADCGIDAMKVAAALWVRCGVTKRNTIEFSLRQYAELVGLDRSNVHRALRRLERAGLVVMDHHPRRRLKVTIIERKPSA